MRKIGAGVIALGFKIGSKLLSIIIKFAKVIKVGKVGLAVGSTISYAYLFTWPFALMVMVLLFIHESGHIYAMKRCGLKTKGIYFIPFMGAAAVTDEMFKTRRDEAYIAIMGPIWGFILSGIAAIIYMTTKNALFAAAAGWMAMVNLFNLLPISPLDGGRILKSIIFSINSRLGLIFLIVGIIISTILIFWAGMILFLILLIIASLEFIYEYKITDDNEIINRCIKDLDKVISDNPPDGMTHAANNIKNILLNNKEDPSARIKTVISLQTKTDYDIDTKILAHIISPKLKMSSSIPKMTIKGIIIMSIAYIGIIAILWALMTYMNHIPEVEIARKFFMS